MSKFISKYLIKDHKKDIVHTSTYSRAQSGDNIGSASTESFAARLALERNRQHVGGYHRSEIVNKGINGGKPKAKTFEPKRGMGPSRPPKSPGI